MYRPLFTFLLVFVLIGTSDAQPNRKKFYFRLKDFEEPRVYVMSNPQEPSRSSYYYLQSSGDTLITRLYDFEGNLWQEFQEVFDERGAYIARINLFFPLGQDEIMESTMHLGPDPYVFLWRPSTTFSFWIESPAEDGGERTTRSRNPGNLERMQVMGRRTKVLVIEEEFSLDSDEEFSFTATTYYAKKRGLVKVEVRYPEDEMLLQLTEILTEAEWLDRL